ncbi:MAG: beta-lactamase family protein [Saprospiraceae bacterium]|nr:beta-lactamase family protein [Saprospiraceae bacterium]
MLVFRTDAQSGSSKLVRQLDTYFATLFHDDQPGGSITIIRNDSLIFEAAYGLADLNLKEPITPNTLFNLGSISKTFVANGILLLQEEGRLSVEDHLLKYFPDFRNKDIARKVKIKHLMTHTSGLPDCREVAKNPVFYLTAQDEENWYPITRTNALVFEPGTDFEYSNPAFNGLALIIEQVSGMKWQEFIAQKIFRPSGMLTSTITDGPHPETRVAHGYIESGGRWTEQDYGEEPTFPAAGNGGVWSSVRELVNYERAIQKSIFLKPETIETSRTIKEFQNWNGKTTPFIGWSWFIGRSPKGLRTVGHTGSQGGFLCNYVTVPDKNIQFVILCNTPLNVDMMTAKIFEFLDL